MSLRSNVVANYLGAGVSAIAPILALPWYIGLLGAKHWGLVSFIWVLQSVLGLLNAGLAQALIREVSGLIADIQFGKQKIAAILYGFERIYWGFAIAAGVLVVCLTNVIVVHWLKLGDISVETGRLVIYAAAIIFMVQFPVALYRSVIFGCGGQIKQNVIASVATVVRHLGGVVLLLAYSSITTYLIWNIFVAFAETLATAKYSWNILGIARSRLSWDRAEMNKIFLLTIGLSASVFLGVLTLQVDKIVLSWTLPIEQLGYYTIATAVSVGLLQLFTPITNAVLPRAVQLQGRANELRKLNFKVLGLMGAIVGSGVLSFTFFGKWLLLFWLRDENVVAIVFPVLSLLLVGTGMNALYSVGYINWVAAAATKKILWINATALVLSIALLPVLIQKYQLIGAAFGWITINSLGLLFSMDWIIKRKEALEHV